MSSFSNPIDKTRFLPLKITLGLAAAGLLYWGYLAVGRYRAAVVRIDSVKEFKASVSGIERYMKKRLIDHRVNVVWQGLKTSPQYENILPRKGWSLFREARGYVGSRHVFNWLITANYRADGSIENYILELTNALPPEPTPVEQGPTAYGIHAHAKEIIARDSWLRDKTNLSLYAYPYDHPKHFNVTAQIILDRQTLEAMLQDKTP